MLRTPEYIEEKKALVGTMQAVQAAKEACGGQWGKSRPTRNKHFVGSHQIQRQGTPIPIPCLSGEGLQKEAAFHSPAYVKGITDIIMSDKHWRKHSHTHAHAQNSLDASGLQCRSAVPWASLVRLEPKHLEPAEQLQQCCLGGRTWQVGDCSIPALCRP